jgi:hypothetical protein
MALWLAIQVIQIRIFDQLDEAYWLFSFTKKIHSFGGRRNVNVKGNASRSKVLSPTLFNMYINDAPQTHGVHLALFADETYLYTTDGKEGFVVRKLQRGLSSMETWSEHWSIKIN